MTTGEPHRPVRQDSTAVRVGWLGLGAMGLPMARRLLADGFPVRAFDPGPDKLAAAAGAVACRGRRRRGCPRGHGPVVDAPRRVGCHIPLAAAAEALFEEASASGRS